jgi:hypothetical protein
MCEIAQTPRPSTRLASLRLVAEAASGRLETRCIAVFGRPGHDAAPTARPPRCVAHQPRVARRSLRSHRSTPGCLGVASYRG